MLSREPGLQNASTLQNGLPALRRQIGGNLAEIRRLRGAAVRRFEAFQAVFQSRLAELQRAGGQRSEAPALAAELARPQLSIHA